MNKTDLVLLVALFFFSRYLLMWGLLWIERVAPASKMINREDVRQAQKDRESMWPMGLMADTFILSLLIVYNVLDFWEVGFWLSFGVMWLVHVVVVEPIYYIYHRILHTPWLYKHHHIYHHRSTRTEPTTSMSFTLSERLSYTVMFSIPAFVAIYFNLFNFWALIAFYLVFDFLNAIGHLNLKIMPKWYEKSPLRWIIYSPEFHEKHHSEVVVNYSLFVPWFDKVMQTCSKKSK